MAKITILFRAVSLRPILSTGGLSSTASTKNRTTARRSTPFERSFRPASFASSIYTLNLWKSSKNPIWCLLSSLWRHRRLRNCEPRNETKGKLSRYIIIIIVIIILIEFFVHLKFDCWMAFQFKQDEDLKEIIEKAREMEDVYGHFFDMVIVNGEEERTYSQLVSEVNRLEREPQWVPVVWLDRNSNDHKWKSHSPADNISRRKCSSSSIFYLPPATRLKRIPLDERERERKVNNKKKK